MTSEVLRRGRTTSLKAWQVRIFAITWLAYAGFYLTRKSLSVAKIELKKPEVWGLSTETLAAVDGGYLIAYAAGQFLWGVLGDRVGTRRVVLAGMAGSVAVAVAMGSAATAAWLGVLFALQGVFQSSGWAPLTKNMGEFFPRRVRGRVMGLWCTNFALGGMIAGVVAGGARWLADGLLRAGGHPRGHLRGVCDSAGRQAGGRGAPVAGAGSGRSRLGDRRG